MDIQTIIVQFFGPEAFGLHLAIVLVTLIVVGGRGAIPASLLGALFVVYVPRVPGEIKLSASDVVYDAVSILFMFVLRYGLAGLVRALGHHFRPSTPSVAATAQPKDIPQPSWRDCQLRGVNSGDQSSVPALMIRLGMKRLMEKSSILSLPL